MVLTKSKSRSIKLGFRKQSIPKVFLQISSLGSIKVTLNVVPVLVRSGLAGYVRLNRATILAIFCCNILIFIQLFKANNLIKNL